jgi:hypothetical protein
MYRIVICNQKGEEVHQLSEEEQLDFKDERAILKEWPVGYYIDIARVPINTRSDSFAFGNIDISQESYE